VLGMGERDVERVYHTFNTNAPEFCEAPSRA
jgi:hypothetical protein